MSQILATQIASMPLNVAGVYPASDPKFAHFVSRRSVVHSTKGIVSSTQPLATNCGLRILQQGGNCAVSQSTIIVSFDTRLTT